MKVNGKKLSIKHQTLGKGKVVIKSFSKDEGFFEILIKEKVNFLNVYSGTYNGFSFYPLIIEKDKDGYSKVTAYWIKHREKDNYELESIMIDMVIDK